METIIKPCRITMLSALRRSFVVITLVLGLLALSPAPNAFGVTPAPDGGYPGANTAEGDNALLSLTTGNDNTAIGFQALLNNTTGSANTANGFDALENNTTGGDNTAIGYVALYSNTSGSNSVAKGVAGCDNHSPGENDADGRDAGGSR